jgi:hypothetical protein
MRQTEPTQITQGEAIEWERSFCDYPATLWTLQYRFRGVGPGLDAAATADGEDFAVSVAGTDTAKMSVGRYQWQAWATEIADTTNTLMIASGTVDVLLGFVSGDTADVDLRTNARKTLDAIDAALLTAAADAVVEYEITTPTGTHRVRRSRSEALEQRKYWAGIVAREDQNTRIRNGGKFATAVKVRMFEK